MKLISVHVPAGPYQELKLLARGQGRPVAEIIRQAMIEYLERRHGAGRSVLELRPHRSGRLRKRWTRADLLDEMRGT